MKKKLEMSNCLRSHLWTRDKLLCDEKYYTIFVQRFERNHAKDQCLCIAIIIKSYHLKIFYSQQKSNQFSILKKKGVPKYSNSYISNSYTYFCAMYIFQIKKKEKEFLNNVIQSMCSLSIDHMGFFTYALTSNMFDHIC